MPKVTPKIELLIDLNNPVEEIKGCIMAIGNAHPGKQLEILQQVDLWLGEQVGKIEIEIKKQIQTADPLHKEEPKAL